MFVGVNTLTLNEATLKQIVQEWLGRNLTDPPQVTSVCHKQEGMYPMFEISLKQTDESK